MKVLAGFIDLIYPSHTPVSRPGPMLLITQTFPI